MAHWLDAFRLELLKNVPECSRLHLRIVLAHRVLHDSKVRIRTLEYSREISCRYSAYNLLNVALEYALPVETCVEFQVNGELLREFHPGEILKRLKRGDSDRDFFIRRSFIERRQSVAKNEDERFDLCLTQEKSFIELIDAKPCSSSGESCFGCLDHSMTIGVRLNNSHQSSLFVQKPLERFGVFFYGFVVDLQPCPIELFGASGFFHKRIIALGSRPLPCASL